MLRLLQTLWALPVTLLGMVVALMARSSGGVVQRVEGVLEAAGGWPARILQRGFPFSGPVAAITLGHVVVGLSQEALDATRIHERVHVRQFERWGVSSCWCCIPWQGCMPGCARGVPIAIMCLSRRRVWHQLRFVR